METPQLRQPPTAFDLLQLVRAEIISIEEARRFLLGDDAGSAPKEPAQQQPETLTCPLCKTPIRMGARPWPVAWPNVR
jgi:hypothetical protein